MDLLISGGIVLLAIVLISVYAVYLFFLRLFKLSKERLDTEDLMVRVNAAVRDRDLDLALDACEQHGGPVARVLQAALLRLPYGRQAVEAAFAEASLLEEQSLTRGLRPLATIAQVAPLLGLLGTVTGMIIAFGEISASGTGNPSLLAGGIGQALVTTAAGLMVAIPVLIGQNYLANRVDGILTEIDRRREELMANVVQAVAGRRDAGRDEVGNDEVVRNVVRSETQARPSDRPVRRDGVDAAPPRPAVEPAPTPEASAPRPFVREAVAPPAPPRPIVREVAAPPATPGPIVREVAASPVAPGGSVRATEPPGLFASERAAPEALSAESAPFRTTVRAVEPDPAPPPVRSSRLRVERFAASSGEDGPDPEARPSDPER